MCAPVPIRTQCFKHKVGFVENEESRRYISGTPEVFFPEEWRAAPTGNKKQGSDGPLDDVSQAIVSDLYQNSVEIALGAYEAMLAQGASPEQARFVLPQGCEVNWYWTGNLMSFARFYNQRTDSHAQGEITELAEAVGEIIAPLFPMAWPLLTNK
jgi:thymidylate synthase (FAD)